MHMDTQTHIDRSTHVHMQSTCTVSDCLDVYMKYLMPFFNFIGAGVVVAAALPNLKCLRKVTVQMNPVAVLQTVGLCEKLQEMSVYYPKHCEVGMRCAYRWM